MRIAILGYGGQGQSSLEYWNSAENRITVCDRDEGLQLPDGIEGQLGENYLQNLDRFDVLVRTPALHPRDIQAANPDNPDILKKVWSNTNEFFKVCPTRHIIGVTGTKGKGTTSTLITRILEAAGQTVHLGGNIGTPPLEMLKNGMQATDWVVLELANFQLIDLEFSPAIAVCLMVVPEHMDWHGDFDEYTLAKKQLFVHQNSDDVAIYYADNQVSTDIAHTSNGKILPYCQPPGAYVSNNKVMIADQTLCSTDELKLLGRHNWQNVCAAVTAVWQITQDTTAIRSVLTDFSGLEYRLEFIRELDGVKYYNDSFGTTPETAIVAMQAFTQPKILILGGSDKGAGYGHLARAVKENNIRCVVTIGQTGPAIAVKLRDEGYQNILETSATTMGDVVQAAKQQALPGDIVLLSTGCASFDLFKNYKDRGDQFNQAVQALAEAGQ